MSLPLDRRPEADDDCPNEDLHTQAPKEFTTWISWAHTMRLKGYHQERCPGCGQFKIWVKK